jgi:hypothetical protein
MIELDHTEAIHTGVRVDPGTRATFDLALAQSIQQRARFVLAANTCLLLSSREAQLVIDMVNHCAKVMIASIEKEAAGKHPEEKGDDTAGDDELGTLEGLARAELGGDDTLETAKEYADILRQTRVLTERLRYLQRRSRR